MAKSMNRHFKFIGSSKDVRSGQVWYPAAGGFKTPGGWVVKLELAGVSADDIEIDIQDNILYIAGARKDRSCSAGATYHQMEITYSRFEKSLKFPSPIDGAKIEHKFEDGLLLIELTER